MSRVDYHCNVCGTACVSSYADLTREAPTCPACASTVRTRAVVHLLSLALFGRSLCLDRFPTDKSIVGLGLSDWEPYARRLAEKFDYTNTHYDREPRLDITSADGEDGTLDFLVATEVFEHVAPPVSRAFASAARLLKDDGVFIFTVPYVRDRMTTLEHFPDLWDYVVEESESSGPVLVNRTAAGVTQRFTDLVFHGGEGSTLEMRVFGQQALLEELAAAGFDHVSILRRGDRRHGIVWHVPWSLPILASRTRLSRMKRQDAWRRAVRSEGRETEALGAALGERGIWRRWRRRLARWTGRLGLRLGLPNPLFDAAWYRQAYPDVPRGSLRAWLHWRRRGWREGRDPDPLFDTDWYIGTYPDVGASGMDPLAHYLLHGSVEGRDPGPGFDASAYLQRYPDVWRSGLDPLLHYLRFGSAEGRVVTPLEETGDAEATGGRPADQ